ncbi:cell division ATP-binding protein FtsE [Collinsella intestinalis]|uniref:cell division ATP-binding protein FtsE n=1 Tax=Collinsella intestinalis TaxID=147207 RepID=UPI00195B874B|nr:cell division ATP-binding protein FtsE [Collinsella intestinalis]MBM6942697.1 cell division ATP-binding protein FtsE [Collinsella intestinalis]
MANHFRKPEDGQDEFVTPSAEPVAASHFALSPDAAPAPAAPADADGSLFDAATPAPAPAAPAASSLDPGDTGAFLASAGVTTVPAALNVPEVPAVPEVSAEPEPEVTPDQAEEIADLNAALADPGFTTVFAPVESPRKQAREAGVEPVILFEHVTKVYPAQPNKPALDDVNIEIYPGEFVFLVGHSGSGKTTLLRTMTRDVKPTSGRVLVAGQDLMKLKNRKVPFFRRQIGTVFQDFKLLPGKTVYENVAFVLQCIGKPRGVIRTQVPEVLRLVGLGDQMDSMPDQLSGGEQQRVSVARAMVNRPPLLICDEPTGNLDPAISLGIMKLLERINRTGTTVIVATHDREMVDSMRRRVISLEAGHVVRDQERGGYGNYGA